MIHIKEAIIVEGKYDKERLRKITDAPILCTHGFELYRSKALINSIRNFAKNQGVIILTDSDRAGFRIRNYLKSCLGNDCHIKNAYIPSIAGKERRKDKPGKDGLLGVEGMEESLLEQILKTATTSVDDQTPINPVTKTDFFTDGLTGKPDSAERRKKLCKYLRLPPRISANALLELLNQIGGYPIYQEAMTKINSVNGEFFTNIKQAAIFDLDGTLIDSMWIWENLLVDFLKARNLVAPEHMLNEVTHMSLVQSSAYVQEFFQLPMTPAEVHKEWTDTVYAAYAEKIKLKPGAKEYLHYLKDQGVKLAVATSCDPRLCQACLKQNGVLPLFDVITYADEVGKGKNYPDIYLECLKRLNCSLKDAVLFEDILVALRTGKSIGMRVIIMEDQSAKPDWPLLKKEADRYIQSFHELME